MNSRLVLALFLLSLMISGVVVVAVQPIKATYRTIVVPDDYATIQEAVNHANTGDTVLVKSGNYSETVLLNKPLLLVGLNYPVVNAGGKGSPITINASNCVVDGFKVTGCLPSASEAGIKVQYYSGGNNTIRNNIAYGNSLNGIYLQKTDHNSVINNTVFSNHRGIECWVESDDYLANNTVYSNGDIGILVGSATRMSVVDNIVYLNGEGGIMLDGCENSYVGRNSLFSNQFGINLDYGGSHNIIVGNNVSENEWGFRWFSGLGNNFLFHNNIINNTVQARWYDPNGTYPVGNFWNDLYPSGGNFWSDYNGTDANGDGMGDTPYVIGTNNVDESPLIVPYHTAENTYQLVNFAGSFKDDKGASLYTEPSSFKLTFPNGTTSPPLTVGSYLMETGTGILQAVIWEGTDVTPEVLCHFSTDRGNPILNCRVYQFTINPIFYDVALNQTLQPSSWSIRFPNQTIVAVSSSVTYNQTQVGDYDLRNIVLGGLNFSGVYSGTFLSSNAVWTPRIGIFRSPLNNETFGFDSNSTITQPNYYPIEKVLSFTAAGPDGTSGYAKIIFAKNLTTNPEGIVVRQDGNQIEYSITSMGDSYLLAINYTHSAHNIAIDFGANVDVIPEFPRSTILLVLMLLTALATVFLKHKRIGDSQTHRLV